ncbi:MAG: RDD family protein, partial [Ilumatobacteraceae bacterium]|nr:RDD family protein [Ilumatobacteraceae bacterium]
PPPSSPPPPPPPPVFTYGQYDRSLAHGPLAGFWIRFGAWVLDGLLYGLLVIPFAVVGVVLIAPEFEDCVSFDDELICPDGKPGWGMVVLGGLVILLGVLVAAFLYIRAMANTGQTWGAKIVGVKVVRSEGEGRIGYGRAIGRALFAGFISGQVFYLGYLWAAWDKQKQTWHDKVCDTIVVKV